MKQLYFFTSVLFFCFALNISAQDNNIEIYGFAMTDLGYNANQIHPDWYDVVRPTKLPTFENQYGTDGNFFASVRQSRLGVKSNTKTPLGNLFTQFEFEMFGTGVDAGQTTIRLRHAYGQLGHFGAGQYWSPFMDIDVFPNTVEYWGPTGMAFFRNVQVRYMPIMGDTRLTFALERPGASSDAGVYSGRNELQGVVPKFPVPDFSMEYRYAGKKWGYVEFAGIVRYMKWEDQNSDTLDLSGDAVGWGVNLSSNLKVGNHVVRLQGLYGEGIENYMNDAPVDVGIQNNFSDPRKPVKGVALPVYGVVAFIDFNWNKKFSTSIGYSRIEITNSDGQDSLAFKVGNYAVANLMYYPAANVMAGVELQWGNRENYLNNAFKSDIFKVQFSFKYNFSKLFTW
jgi:hypothetical protein